MDVSVTLPGLMYDHMIIIPVKLTNTGFLPSCVVLAKLRRRFSTFSASNLRSNPDVVLLHFPFENLPRTLVDTAQATRASTKGSRTIRDTITTAAKVSSFQSVYML